MRRGVPREAWLVSPRFDLLAFLAPALLALALVPLAPAGGDLPLPGWVIAVLLVDVAHVWATLHRSYLDLDMRARRTRALVIAPIAAYAIGVALHLRSPAWFWTALAYLAVWHFVRQQYGWIALLHRNEGVVKRFDRRLDVAAIYLATLAPLVWWHAHLPRRFDWFVSGDFLAQLIPEASGAAAIALSCAVLALFVGRQIQRWWRGEGVWITKIVVVVTTAACWYVGIVLTDSDWAFTFTNVLIHGVPYLGFVWIYKQRSQDTPRGWVPYYLVLVALAFMEEWGWDRLVWHDHGAIFPGAEWGSSADDLAWLVPLLALPQATHYLLDAFIWRRVDARDVRRSTPGPASR